MKHLPLALCLLLPVSLAHGETVAIDHKPVGCMVAGKYPRLNACFAPASKVGRARLYFRAAGAGADWYYVEMKSDAPCHAGVLPRPKKDLVGTDVLYYLEAADRGFDSARTEEFRSRVVAKASDCEARLPLPALLDKAAVAVFPSLPAGFAGGSAGLGAAAIVGGGAALAGGAVAVASSQGGDTPAAPATTPTTSPAAGFPVVTTTTTTTTTLVGFTPVFKVLKAGVEVNPDATISGADPLTLTFDMCDSVAPAKLAFAVLVDGATVAAGCRSTVTFTASGATASGSVRRAVTTGKTYEVTMRMQSDAPNNDPKATKKLAVEIAAAAPTSGCTVDKQGPEVRVVSPPAGATYPSSTYPYPVRFEAFADDSKTGNNGLSVVEYKVNYPGPTQAILDPGTTISPFTYLWAQKDVETWLGVDCKRDALVQVYAVDKCGNSSYSASVSITLGSTSGSCTPPVAVLQQSSTALQSELSVPGGRGQLVVDGDAVFVRDGRSPVTLRGGSRQARVEATLVDARAAGTWRFDLGSVPGLAPESIRVVAGEVVQSAGGILVFRVHGRPGERIVFSFATK